MCTLYFFCSWQLSVLLYFLIAFCLFTYSINAFLLNARWTALLRDFWSRPKICFVNWLEIDFLKSTYIKPLLGLSFIFEVIWQNMSCFLSAISEVFMQRNRLERAIWWPEVIMQIYAFGEQFRVCVTPSVYRFGLWALGQVKHPFGPAISGPLNR